MIAPGKIYFAPLQGTADIREKAPAFVIGTGIAQ
jgi:hypothetical protein